MADSLAIFNRSSAEGSSAEALSAENAAAAAPLSIADLLSWADEENIDRNALIYCLQHRCNYSQASIRSASETFLNATTLSILRPIAEALMHGQPLAYILGEVGFWSFDLKVNEHVLIPRPDTECLVEAIVELPLPNNAKCLDMGTGSGAIALALAKEKPLWEVSAIDKSEAALAVAQDNAQTLNLQRVQFLQSDWFAALEGKTFNVIVSNPPYIAEGDAHLPALVAEPLSALVSGKKGLDDIEFIIRSAKPFLHDGGYLYFEHGFDQAEAVAELFKQYGYDELYARKDYAQQDRVSGARKMKPK